MTLQMDYREALGHALDLSERDVDRAQEVGAKTGGACFVPEGGGGDVFLGDRTDDEVRGHPA